METENTTKLHGVAAEYADADALLSAVQKARSAGYSVMDAYSPIPVHGLYEAMGGKRTLLPFITLAGGIAGVLGGMALQIYASAIDYPLNVGGRPYISWTSFFPVAFECMILGAAIATLLGLFTMCKFPLPYHAIFNTPNFEAASNDRFFLCIESEDPQFNVAALRQLLESTGASAVSEVTP